MSAGYKTVLWNGFKVKYDLLLWGTIIIYLLGFLFYNLNFHNPYNLYTALIRGFGTLAILLLHVILMIGPAARINTKWLPLLYNRRHLGVTMFCMAAAHGALSILWFHGNGNIHPLLSVFQSNVHYGSFIFFPFQTLGVLALLILAAMAFTSHDFWLHFLGPRFWKSMHMLVYVAYALIVMHVALGIIQLEKSPVLVVLLFAGMLTIITLHLVAAIKETKKDKTAAVIIENDWQYVCRLDEIEESRAKMAVIDNERIAIFKYDGKLSAVHNVCKHQMGPLSEGKVVDGCITCPWHGYQYKPEDGCAPAPFNEKIHTYQLQLRDQEIYVNIHALPEGTFVQPLIISEVQKEDAVKKQQPFFIGWNPANPKPLLRFSFNAGLLLAVGVLATGLVFSTQQKGLSKFAIDYDHVKEIEGWLMNKPLPMLRIIDGKDINGNPQFKNILLGDGFKHGAMKPVYAFLENDSVRYVKMRGYISKNLISCGKDGENPCKLKCVQCIEGTNEFPLMELENGVYSFEKKSAPIAFSTEQLINTESVILKGEIVDSKCYLGAMNPGYSKVHLSCAVRCISGGLVPMLVYKENNIEQFVLLTGKNFKPVNNELLRFVGKPVKVSGSKFQYGNWSILQISKINELELND